MTIGRSHRGCLAGRGGVKTGPRGTTPVLYSPPLSIFSFFLRKEPSRRRMTSRRRLSPATLLRCGRLRPADFGFPYCPPVVRSPVRPVSIRHAVAPRPCGYLAGPFSYLHRFAANLEERTDVVLARSPCDTGRCVVRDGR